MKKFMNGKLKLGFGNYNFDQFVIVAVYGDKFFMRIFPKPQTVLRAIRFRLTYWACFLQLWPVYFVVFRRDCDMHESTRCRRYPCFAVAMWHLRREAEDWTEGPFNFYQVSRKEAREFKDETRDRILEAFEDGRGSHTVIALALVILSSFMTGCSEADQDKHWPRQSYELFDGTQVECRWTDQTPCGLKLYDCTNGQVYNCQTSVTEL